MRCTLAVIALLVSVSAASPVVHWADIPMEESLLGPRAPVKCCIPDAFEVKSHGHVVFHNENGSFLVGQLSEMAVDKRLRKIAENTTVHAEDRKPEDYDTVIDDRKHKIYFINRQRDCSTEHSIPEVEWHLCIPNEADYDGEERIGSGAKEEGVLAHAWRWRVDEPLEGHEAAGVTEKDCTPVWRDFSGSNEREKFEVHAYNGYADFQEGIKNPSVFDVPKPCRDVMAPLELSLWLRSVDYARTHYYKKYFF